MHVTTNVCVLGPPKEHTEEKTEFYGNICLAKISTFTVTFIQLAVYPKVVKDATLRVGITVKPYHQRCHFSYSFFFF